MNRFPGSAAVGRAHRWLIRRVRSAHDGGFILLESVIAIGVITVIMSAVGVEFVTATAATSHQRNSQVAAQLADSAVEQIRALAPSDLVVGRDASSVTAEFAAAPTSVQPWLAQMDKASDANAPAGSGGSAAIPTTGVVQTPGNVAYTVTQYLGWCYIPVSGSTDCVKQATLGLTRSFTYLRAVAAVTWAEPRCPTGCSFVTSTLINVSSDATFRVGTLTPLTIVDPGPQAVSIDDAVSLPLTTITGFPPYTWSVLSGSFPGGVSITPDGLVSGTVSGAVGSFTVTVQVVDGTARKATLTIVWTVTPKLTIAATGTQASTLSQPVTKTMTATGGSGTYVWSDSPQSLPAGLTISPAGVITGIPTVLGSSTVLLTVNDTNGHTATVTFTWNIVARPTVTAPVNQSDTIGLTANVPLAAGCPNTPCTYTLNNGPTGLSVTNAATITGTVGGTVKTYLGVTVTVTDAAGATATSAAFTWTVFAQPTITAPATQTDTIGSSVNVVLTTTCPNAACSYVINNGPAGLSVTAGGVISGTVGGSAQTYSNVTVTVTDADTATATTAAFSWIVQPTIVLTTVPAQATVIGNQVNLTLSASGGGGAPFTYSVLNASLPPGLALSSTGVITGSPTTSGTFTVQLKVVDKSGIRFGTGSFTWTISYPPLAASNPGNQVATLNAAISPQLQLSATGGSGNYTWADTPRTLPAGLSISASGLITGTPRALGTSNVIVTVTDTTANFTRMVAFTWQVVARPSLTSPGNQSDSVGVSVNVALTSTCPNSPCSYTLNNGPSGLAVTTTGVISGTLRTPAQTYANATVTITDADGATATTAAFSWVVFAPPTVTAPANQSDTIGGPASVPLTKSCTNAPCTYTLNNGPTGLTVTAAGVITGTVAGTAQTYPNVTVTITDNDRATATTAAFTWAVFARPTITAPANQTDTIGDAVNVTLTTSCTNTPCTYTLNNGPTGLTVTAAGVITGTVAGAAQTYANVTVTVTDNDSATATTAAVTWAVFTRPTITAPPNQSDTIGVAVNVTLTKSCANAPCRYALNNGPTGLTVSAAGVITGTVAGAAQTYSNVTVTITDNDGATATTAAFTWAVFAQPVIAAPPNQTDTIGSAINLTPTGSCTDTPCSYVLNNGPTGLSVNAAGTITGTLGAPAQTYSNVTVTVTDADNVTVTTAVFTWTVQATIVLTTTAQAATVGDAVNFALSASGGAGAPYAYTVLSASLPPGLTLSSTGVVTGSPTTSGTYTVQIRIVDSSGIRSGTGSFNWTIANPPLAASNPGNQVATLNTAISPQLQLRASGGSGNYRWSDSPRTLPAGLSISAGGLITGTPTALGTSNVSVTVTDTTTGFTKSVSFTWTIVAKPTITAPATQISSVGTPVNLSLTKSCPNTPCAFTFNNRAPSGLSITTAGVVTGTISGPAGSYTLITITVTDADGASAVSSTFTWTVNSAPVITSPGNQTTQRGGTVNLDMSTYDSGGTGAYTYSAAGLPSWLTISATSGRITGTAPATNSTTSNIKITITDSTGAVSTTAPFTWNVTNLASSFGSQTTYKSTAVSIDLDGYSSGGSSPYSYTASGLPSWLTLNGSTGVVSGTSPTLAANTSTKTAGVTITVTDTVGAVVTTNSFSWYVTDMKWNAPNPVTTTRGTNVTGITVSSYLAGGSGTKTYSATGLPTGLTLSSNGAITGSTNVSGTYNTVLSATDSVGATVTTAIVWTVQ